LVCLSKHYTFAGDFTNPMRRIVGILIAVIGFALFFLQGEKGNSANAGNLFNDSIIRAPWYTDLIRDEQISPSAFYYAYEGFQRLENNINLSNDSLITLIDFSKPSNQERFYIIDVKNGHLIKKSLVAHGRNSGLVYAENFSNKRYSNMSSLGLFITSNTYKGKHGYSLRIEGLDGELNNNAMQRAVVIHGADYVNSYYIKKNGRIGRSFGCPALPYAISSEVIDLIKEGSCLFIYHPSISSTLQYQQEKVN
jgi:hypothetical protein